MSKLRLLIATVTVVALLLIPTVVLAQPNVCGFYGSVTLDGAPAADNTVVKAWIDGEEVASTTTSGSDYSVYVAGNYTGKAVKFTIYDGVTDVDANSADWEAGENKQLDLISQRQAIEEAAVELMPASGILTQVNGKGFTPNATVGIMWDTPAAANVLVSVQADMTGAFSVVVVPPTTEAGTYTIWAAESATRMASADFDLINIIEGVEGPAGPAGPEGPAGADGAPGAPGADGKDGEDGDDGSAVLGIVALIIAVIAVILVIVFKTMGQKSAAA